MTKEEIKQFVSYVFNEIKNNNYEYMKNIDTDFNIVMSIGEYFHNSIFKGKFKLQKVKKIPYEILGVFYKPAGGAYSDKTKNTFVYVNHFSLIDNINKGALTMLVFHELRHAIQDQNKNNSFMSIVYQMEEKNNNMTYLLTHDNWFSEIDADVFGIKEAMSFMEKHSDRYTKRDFSFVGEKLYKKRCLLRNYDYDKLFLNYSTYKLKHPEYKENLEWETIFFDEKGYIKSLNEILFDERLNRVDEYFVRRFVTSEVFNNSCDINDLSDESVKFLYQQYCLSLDEEENNYDFLNVEGMKLKHLDKYQKKSLDRLERYEKMIEVLNIELKKNRVRQIRKESFGYISVIGMSIALLILICLFMLFVILKIEI